MRERIDRRAALRFGARRIAELEHHERAVRTRCAFDSFVADRFADRSRAPLLFARFLETPERTKNVAEILQRIRDDHRKADALGVLLYAAKKRLRAFECAELGVRVSEVDALRARVSNFADAFERGERDFGVRGERREIAFVQASHREEPVHPSARGVVEILRRLGAELRAMTSTSSYAPSSRSCVPPREMQTICAMRASRESGSARRTASSFGAASANRGGTRTSREILRLRETKRRCLRRARRSRRDRAWRRDRSHRAIDTLRRSSR